MKHATSIARHGLLMTAFVALLPAIALADVAAQNAGAQRFVGLTERAFKCPETIFRRVQQALSATDLPPHLRASQTAQRQTKLTFYVEYFKQMPREYQQMLLAQPGALDDMAAELGLSPEQLKGTLTSGQASIPRPAPFLTRRSAEISVHSELGTFCDAQCLTNIRWSLMTAIAGWKTACLSCSDDFLLAVSIDGHVWLDGRVSKWLRDGPDATDGFPFTGESNAVKARVSPQLYGSPSNSPEALSKPMSLQMYELIDKNDPKIRRICDAKGFRAPRSDALGQVQWAICGNANVKQASSVAKMRLHLKSGPTSCGPSEEFLGCGQPDNSIELTFEETRYRFWNVFGSADMVVGPGGSPPLSGMAVVFHEVGHWFGLPHLNYKANEIPDMMQDTYREDACGSELNLLLMSNMSDENHAQRFRVGGGYRRRAAR